jgi:hypothetical protein
MAILTTLSDNSPKHSVVDVVDRCRGNGKENLEDMSSPRKYEMPNKLVLNESEAWLVQSKETVTLKPWCKQDWYVVLWMVGNVVSPHGSCVCGTCTDTD